MSTKTPTVPSYSPGLEGVIAGESAICQVDPKAGLLYRGYDVETMATQSSFEEIVWLLLYGELPTTAQCEDIREQLAAERHLPQPILSLISTLPHDINMMDLLRTTVSMLATYDPDLNDHSHDANMRKAIRLISKISTLVTTGWRLLHNQHPYGPGTDLTHAARVLESLWEKPPELWQTSILDTVFVLYAEHEFNASTFAARVTASTMADMYAAVTSAIGTLKGPLHGGANEAAINMLQEIATPERAEPWLKERLSRKEKIMGFGHRVYRTGDSRVPVMRELARQLGERCAQPQWVPICQQLEAIMVREKGLYANVDLYAAPVLHLLGIPTALNTPIFACSRISGWCAHIIEQHDHNRLIRPRSIYTGPARRLRKLHS